MLTAASSERDTVHKEARSAENPKNSPRMSGTPGIVFLSRMKSALI